jgi:hypothetical protein
MSLSRPLIALVAGPLIAAALLTGCSSSGSSSAPASEVNLSGSPVSTKDDITALCASIVEQSLPAEAAAAMAESSGYTSRITKQDGEAQAATTDLREDRMNFEVEADLVTACTVG